MAVVVLVVQILVPVTLYRSLYFSAPVTAFQLSVSDDELRLMEENPVGVMQPIEMP